MKPAAKDTRTKRTVPRLILEPTGVLVAVLMALGILSAAPASASYETVDHFGGVLQAPSEPNQFPEEVQLGGATAMAVNINGAGGVAPGTIYTVGEGLGTGLHIARYSHDGAFEEAWNGQNRCGPAAEEPAHPTCPAIFSGSGGFIDIEIDQTTGNVYVLGLQQAIGENQTFNTAHIWVYSPNGKLISQFGEGDPEGTIAGSPGKIHERTSERGIAVDESGGVYLFDQDKDFNQRLMVFRPESPGDYEHYVYTGQSSDVASGPQGTPFSPRSPVLDASGNIYVSGEDYIAEYDPAQPSTPICTFSLPSSGIAGHTVSPATGEVFYYSLKNHKIHQLSCNAEGKFVEKAAFNATPQRGDLEALAVDPVRQYEPSRPAGVLYAAAYEATPKTGSGGEPGAGPLGYVLSPPKEFPPLVESESASSVTSSTAALGAQINPMGAATRYAFQYLDDAAYEANEPDERQSLTVSAAGGVFGLGFEGRRFGGPATANLTAGSKAATSLRTATGTTTLKAAVGTGTLKGAGGKGTLVAGSSVITSVSTKEGKFEVGQGIAGEGILARDAKNNLLDTTILAVKAEEGLGTQELTISRPASKTLTHVNLSSGAAALTEVSTKEGSFEVGQAISGGSIPEGTKITAVKAGELVLSKPATKPAPVPPALVLEIRAGFPTLTSVSAGIGSFEVGQPIEGEGIPAGTEISAVKAGELTLSKPVSKSGTGVAISSPGPAPLAVGERIEGLGIAPNTTIASIKAGEATLSNAATASGTGVLLHAGLPADVSAEQLRRALEALLTIGGKNVEVSGGPGDEAGSNPYEITFVGKFENVDVLELNADGSGLSGGAATATVQTEHEGGGGFAGATEAPVGGADLGSGQEALSASTAVSGLSPDTGYHYGAIATSHCSAVDEAKVCEGVGATQAFHTAASEAPALPDNRAYELVSPAQKNGGEVFPAEPNVSSCGPECKPGVVAQRYPMQSSPDGEALVYEGFPFSFGEGAVRFNEYLSRRTASGWQTTTLSPKLGGSGGEQGYKAFDSALTKGLLYQGRPTLSPEAPAEYANLYSQGAADPSSLGVLLTTELHSRPASGSGSFTITYAGASADLSRVFFEANDALSEETPFAPEAVDRGASKNNLYEWAEGQLRLVNVGPGNATTAPGAEFGSGVVLASKSNRAANFSHAISDDGARVFWSSESGQVYVRDNGETTREISDHTGKFLTASADGSMLLLSDGNLFDLETEALTDLTQGQGGFQGIAGQSDDLSSIYFVDTAVLTGEEENEQGAIAQADQNNLYAWQDGESRFVATLLAGDSPAGDGIGTWAPSPVQRRAEASPNGRWLAFLSRGKPTGYDNVGACLYSPTQLKYVPSAPCPEVYLYDSASGKLTCASCNPSNERPQGPSTLRLIMGSQGSLPQPRYLSDSGRLLFDSANSLSSFDTNNGVEDVYEFEPPGVGSCTREGGCLSLISAGHEAIDSNFLTMDPSGKNVFFTTRDQLVLKDKDELVDVYVAREGGGIPSETETSRGECQGEACQPQTTAPNDPTPSSSNFEGAGNVDEQKAAKKHKKKHTKKKHKAKKHAKHKRASSNRGGAK
ncbi:MAG: hypothetical protein QOF13_127 [Solirubrobacterales bacterium]|jgi:hypothetical protein|nr:hypothetical protein [Solirubrobacterales bacterium]